MTTQGVEGKPRRIAPKYIILPIILLIVTLLVASATLVPVIVYNVIFARSDEIKVLTLYYDDLTDPPPRTTMQFDSAGNTLTGYLYEAEDPQGIILIAHGLHGDSNSHLSETLFFLENQWSVFNFDGTGSGDSTGDNLVGLEQMAIDLRAAIKFLSDHEAFTSLPLMLYGHSMGGYATAMVAEESGTDAAVCISGFDTPTDILLSNSRRYAGEAALIGYPFLVLYDKLIFGENANLSAVDAINNTDTSFLVVCGAEDPIVNPADNIYGSQSDIINPNVTYIYVDTAPHNGHSGFWYSAAAMDYRSELEQQLERLSDEYDDNIPAEVLDTFSDTIDREALFELNEEFMNTVLAFFTQAAQEKNSLGA